MKRGTIRSLVVLSCGVLVGAATMACASDSGPELYLMHQHEARVDDRWFVLGGGCAELSSGSSGFGGVGESFHFSITVTDSGGRIQVMVDGLVTVDQFFDREFLDSGQREAVRFELPGEGEQQVVIWGGPDCEPPQASEADEYAEARQEAGAS